MANEGEKGSDLYGVLGLNKECTDSELRNAYKKLALKWHPDRCSASGNAKFVEEAKNKFQEIQQAYSVLSDSNKRFLYDVGVYESDDDENGMGDFLNEMATMMTQTKPNEKGEESFEDLQKLFQEMFEADIVSAGSTSHTAACSASSTYVTYTESSNPNKRNSAKMNFGMAEDTSDFESSYQNFCLGTGGTPPRYQEEKGSKMRNSGGGSSRLRHGTKQKISYGHDHVSTNDYSGISA